MTSEQLPPARNQSKYQVRFDWGAAGAQSVSVGADILVWVDALPASDGQAPVWAALPDTIIAGSIGSRGQIAAWVLARQVKVGDRVTVAVVAAGTSGGPSGRPDDGQFCVEDLLAAGAIIDALADAGIDYISPEAAAAVACFTGLRHATSHILSACVSGQELIASSGPDALTRALTAGDASGVVVLRDEP